MEDDSTKKRKERNAREKGWVIGEGMHISIGLFILFYLVLHIL
jgi:hypothetical protein